MGVASGDWIYGIATVDVVGTGGCRVHGRSDRYGRDDPSLFFKWRVRLVRILSHAAKHDHTRVFRLRCGPISCACKVDYALVTDRWPMQRQERCFLASRRGGLISVNRGGEACIS